MFVRKKKNSSGSYSVQIISKHSGKYTLVKTIGCSFDTKEVEALVRKGKLEIDYISKQLNIFGPIKYYEDKVIENIFDELRNAQIRTVGPELIFGKIYDHIGYNSIDDELLKLIVIARLAFPLSKLKTVDYIQRYQGKYVPVDTIYRFLDKLNLKYKNRIEEINYYHLKNNLNHEINIVFYDMTTLHFEASDEDDLRRTGFSKNGKHRNPQIFLGLLVTQEGYALGYDIYEGNTFEAHTLIPFIEKITKKYNLDQPTIIADSGLMTKGNLKFLESLGYTYVIGARLKSSKKIIKEEILNKIRGSTEYANFVIEEEFGRRLIVEYSENRAKKDNYNRERGLKRLEKDLKNGRLTKSHINNRGYNKYLKMEGSVEIEIDYSKYEKDKEWDGLKGYLTNSNLDKNLIIDRYKNLWVIEKAFRMSKTDLRIRPIYHRLRKRIEAHITVSFISYSILKELERVLNKSKSSLSLKQSMEVTQNMYEIEVMLPESKTKKNFLLKMDEKQSELFKIINSNF